MVANRPVAIRAAADVIAVVVAFGATFVITATHEFVGVGNVVLRTSLLSFIVVATFARMGLYRPQNTVLNLLELRSTLEGAALAASLFLAVLFLVGGLDGQRALVGVATASIVPALLLERRLMGEVRARVHWPGRRRHRTLVCGCNETGRLLMKKIVQAPEAGRVLVGFVDDFVPNAAEVCFRVDRSTSRQIAVPLLGRVADLADVVRENNVTEVLISSPADEHDVVSRLGEMRIQNLRWGIAPELANARADELVVESVGAIPVLRLADVHPHWGYRIAKRILDITVAMTGLVVTAPLWVMIAIAIRFESEGPVLFRQQRVGKSGRRFVILKFRSLRIDTNPYQSSSTLSDRQVTRVGGFLRAAGLDELPQLLNVLRGDMSLVGPRPEMPFFVEGYSTIQRRRLVVKPGITGVWQLSADRQGLEIHDSIEYDLFYISHRSLLLDAVLLFETAVFALTVISRLRGSPEAATPASHTGSSPADDPYVLVALDQRGALRLRSSWRRISKRLSEEPRQVRVLASDKNISVLRAELRDYDDSGLRERVSFVPYRSSAEVIVLAKGASDIITDLDYLGAVANPKAPEGAKPPTVRAHALTGGQRL